MEVQDKPLFRRPLCRISELPTVKLLEAPKDCPNKNRLYKCIKAMKSQKTQEKGLGDLSRTVLTKTDINHLIDKGNYSNYYLIILIVKLSASFYSSTIYVEPSWSVRGLG